MYPCTKSVYDKRLVCVHCRNKKQRNGVYPHKPIDRNLPVVYT